MGYQVIQETSIEKLENKINALLKANWKLQGGVSVTYNIELEAMKCFMHRQ